ncbi:MAG: hypothetical protein ACLT4E_09525 [Clostridium sp.]
MKWGILATGTIAEKFADTVNHMEQEDETLIACASRNLEHGKAFASKYRIEGLRKLCTDDDRQRSRCGLYCNAKQSPL